MDALLLSVGARAEIRDLRDAAAEARRLFVTYFGDADHVPNYVHRLGDNIEQLKDHLADFQTLLEQLRVEYLGLQPFARLLAECEAFLSRNSVEQPFHEVDDSGRAVWRLHRSWQRSRFAFDDKARLLNDGFVLELQRLALYCGRIALTRNTDGSHAGTLQQQHDFSAQRPPQLQNHGSRSSSSTLDSAADSLMSAFRRLQQRGYTLNRMQITSIANPNVDFTQFDQRLREEWVSFCANAGLPPDKVPSLTREMLMAPKHLYNRTTINATARSLHRPINPFTRRQSRHSSFEGEETTYTASIDLHMRKNPILRDYEMKTLNTGGRVIVWSCEDPGLTLYHYLPSNDQHFHSAPRIHPFVLHSNVASSQSERMRVRFYKESHHIVLRRNRQETLFNKMMEPIYTFAQPSLQNYFLSDVRGKTLCERYNVNHISSSRSGQHGESGFQVLYLWLGSSNPHSPPQYTISFFAMTNQQRHLEFRVRWFEAPTIKSTRHNTLQLNFLRPRSGSGTAGSGSISSASAQELSASPPGSTPPSSRLERLKRRLSMGKTSPQMERLAPMVTPPSSGDLSRPMERSPSGFSIAAHSISGCSDRDGAMEPPALSPPPAQIADSFKYLAIGFSSSEDMIGFKSLFEMALSADRLDLLQLPSPMIMGERHTFSPPIAPNLSPGPLDEVEVDDFPDLGAPQMNIDDDDEEDDIVGIYHGGEL